MYQGHQLLAKVNKMDHAGEQRKGSKKKDSSGCLHVGVTCQRPQECHGNDKK